MKVGIITVYYANYGSFYQAEALRNEVEKLGYDCELVNASIRGWKSRNYFLGKFIDGISPKFFMDIVADKINAFNIYRSLKSNVRKTKISPPYMSAKSISKEYDCVIIGSDIIWAVTNPCMKFTPCYFGEGLSTYHFSYATSAMTLSNPPLNIEKRMINGLQGFGSISVRDRFTQKYIEDKLGYSPQVVLDPTLMNPYFGSTGVGGGGYILVYGEDYTDEQIQAIRDFSQKKGWKTKAVSWHQNWCDEFQDVNSGEELQELYKHAEFCASSTFHGTIFAILHHRQFIFFPAPARTEKTKQMLEPLELTNHIYQDEDCLKKYHLIDFEAVENKLEILRKESIQFLKEGLEGCSQK